MSEFCSQGYEDYYVAYIDILGFSNIVRRSEGNPELFQGILAVLRALKWLECPQRQPPQGSFSYAFSDSIVIFAQPNQSGLYWLLYLASNICAQLLTFNDGILTRGGICRGKLYHEELVSGRIVLGRGFIKAYELAEKKGGPPRVLVSNEVYQCCQKLIQERVGWPVDSAFYMDKILRRDCDGSYHLNYLSLWRPSEVGFEEYLDRVREIIIEKRKNNPNHHCKYDWFVKYFNAYVNEVNADGHVNVELIS